MKKRVFSLLLALMLMLAVLPTAVSAADISVTVDGSAVRWTDAVPYIDANSRTMVPLRAVADALGLTVTWNNTSREAGFSDGSESIYFPINTKYARTGSGTYISMDTAAVIVNDRTYAPIRYLAEFFGYTVGWVNATRTVTLTSGMTPNSERPLVPSADDFYWFDGDLTPPMEATLLKNASDVAGLWKARLDVYDYTGALEHRYLLTVNIVPSGNSATVTFTYKQQLYPRQHTFQDTEDWRTTWTCTADPSAAASGFYGYLMGYGDAGDINLSYFWHLGGNMQYGAGQYSIYDSTGVIALVRP